MPDGDKKIWRRSPSFSLSPSTTEVVQGLKNYLHPIVLKLATPGILNAELGFGLGKFFDELEHRFVIHDLMETTTKNLGVIGKPTKLWNLTASGKRVLADLRQICQPLSIGQ